MEIANDYALMRGEFRGVNGKKLTVVSVKVIA